MKPRFLTLLLLIMLISSHSFALDYEITSVIEVGEADDVHFIGPLKWSPDGTRLAFTKGGIIKISDTLGNVRDIIKLDMPIHRWGWVSDSEIAVYMRLFTGKGANTVDRLSTIDVNLRIEKPLHNFESFYGYREIAGHSIAIGPYKTVEGNKYYIQTTYQGKGKKPVNKRHSFVPSKAETIKKNRFLRWADSGLYMVRLDETDSTWLAEKPFSQMGAKPEISLDLAFAMDGGQLFRLEDSTLISIDTLLGPLPPNTILCGIVRFSFNPVESEVLFMISCDDGENYIFNRIATFDYETFELKVIDSNIGISNCAAPIYSTDGRKIAFIANNKAYILSRSIQ